MKIGGTQTVQWKQLTFTCLSSIIYTFELISMRSLQIFAYLNIYDERLNVRSISNKMEFETETPQRRENLYDSLNFKKKPLFNTIYLKIIYE